MGEAIEESSSEDGVSEDITPAGELEIGRDQHRARFVALGEELEEQRTPRPQAQYPSSSTMTRSIFCQLFR